MRSRKAGLVSIPRCVSMQSAACLSMAAALSLPAAAENIVFPTHAAVKNVKTAFNAKGDGTTDDTQPLNTAFQTGDGVIYLPNGTYRVTNTINGPSGGSSRGPWVYGQSRDGVVIKLDNGAAGFGDTAAAKAVISAAGTVGSADHFMRQWHNFTVDAGANAGAIGVRFYSNNSGVLHNVRITGNGKYGLDMGWQNMNGPLLIQDVTIEGFGVGLYTSFGLNSQTVTGLTVRNAARYGVYSLAQNLSMEDVTIENAPIAVFSRCMMVIVNGTFTGTDATKPAILSECCYLYCRNITTTGFSRSVKNMVAADSGVSGATVSEYASEPVSAGFSTDRRAGGLNLPIKKTPSVNWEEDVSKWVSVTTHGAVAGDDRDDSRAFQAAIDTAAAQGKTTVYFPPGDYYTLGNDVHVHGSVRHLIGLGFNRVMLTTGMMSSFILDETAAPVVRFENFYTFSPSVPGSMRTVVSNNSSALVIDHSDGWTISAAGSGDVFINNTCALLEITNPAAHVWIRQWDTEGTYGIDTDNRGGFLWILGLKTEQGMNKITTSAGGMTELLGAHIYNTNSALKTEPLFEIIDAYSSFACVRETCYNGNFFANQVRETRGATVRTWRNATNRTWALYSGADSTWTPPSLSGVRREAAPRASMPSVKGPRLAVRLGRSTVPGGARYDCRGVRLRAGRAAPGICIMAAPQD